MKQVVSEQSNEEINGQIRALTADGYRLLDGVSVFSIDSSCNEQTCTAGFFAAVRLTRDESVAFSTRSVIAIIDAPSARNLSPNIREVVNLK